MSDEKRLQAALVRIAGKIRQHTGIELQTGMEAYRKLMDSMNGGNAAPMFEAYALCCAHERTDPVQYPEAVSQILDCSLSGQPAPVPYEQLDAEARLARVQERSRLALRGALIQLDAPFTKLMKMSEGKEPEWEEHLYEAKRILGLLLPIVDDMKQLAEQVIPDAARGSGRDKIDMGKNIIRVWHRDMHAIYDQVMAGVQHIETRDTDGPAPPKGAVRQ